MEINRRPKSLNFADAAEPCLRHMTLNYDADLSRFAQNVTELRAKRN